MRKQFLATLATLPLLLSGSHAAQTWMVDSSQPYGIGSEDSGPTSYLGVDIADITTDRMAALKLKEEKGVEITMVDQDAPAGKAGIKEHDVVLTMNGTPIESKAQLQRMIHETPAGRVVTLGLSRDGQPVTIKVQLGSRSKDFSHFDNMDNVKDLHIEIPPIPNLPEMDMPNIGVVYVRSSMRSGLMVENLTPQLGEFFGTKSGNGVLVRSVEKGSRAEKAGLHAGDVIIRIADQPIHDTSDFAHALHSRHAGSVPVGVIRDKKEQTLTLTLPEQRDSGEIIEESFEAPDLNAERQREFSELQSEVARLRPQMELARQEAVKSSAAMESVRCAQEKLVKEQAEKVKKEVDRRAMQEAEKSMRLLRQEMERLRQQMHGQLFEI
ncbi:MAG: PDZ domain-containing protein [Candidatus Sulfotelmatobacter sp.]|jgi:serine protease Do